MNATDRIVSPKIRRLAAGKDCQLNIPGVCRRLPEYTIGAHLRLFGVTGIAQKPTDIHLIFACDKCHHVLDHRDLWRKHELTGLDILRALMATQRIMLREGLITATI